MRPEITHEVAGEVTVHDKLPGLAVSVYEVAPATVATVTVALPLAAVALGALELAIGVTLADAAELAEVSELAVAVDENVYAVPLVRPVTLQLVAGAVIVHVTPAGLEVKV